MTDKITDRGFRHAPLVEGTYGGGVRVYESSAADGPHVWVSATDHNGLEGTVHLTLEDALLVAENIVRVCRLHYQIGAERAKDKAREQAEFDRHSTDALAMVAEAGSRNRHPSAR